MDIFQIAIIGIAGTILAITVKQYKPEFAVIVAIATGIAILIPMFNTLVSVIDSIKELAESYGVGVGYISVVIKIIAVAYICQFSADMCRDGGQSAAASKIEFGGKVIILLYSLPIARSLLEMVKRILA